MIKRIAILGIAVIVFNLFISVNLFSYDAPMKKKKKDDAPKPILLTTGDLKEDYEILGLISAVTGSTDMDNLQSAMIDKARRFGADYVISIRFISHAGSLYCYGTAVKIKKPVNNAKTSEASSSKVSKNP